ncbi:hypothetical protein B1812_06075 [Methylocystis bryophila]|uniref:Uncharacterized protein n=1 Tax=Methylocystis bryophila TaxID=655015 RepID=A0A1W6MSX9_9HYPH|nr:hypothetical protein B1812_06075 [Methylocystis bryophila]
MRKAAFQFFASRSGAVHENARSVFSGQGVLQVFNLERVLFDRVIARDWGALSRLSRSKGIVRATSNRPK